MSPRSTHKLLAELARITKRNLTTAESFLALPSTTLHQRPRPDAWSVLECFAHVNTYGDYYLPEISQQISQSNYTIPQPTYSSSCLGHKLAVSLKPKPRSRKFKSPAKADPRNFDGPLDKSVITEFIRQQNQTLLLLADAARVDLTRTKTGTSISKLLKLRLCDTLRVFVYHNWRHVEQAQRAVESKQTGAS